MCILLLVQRITSLDGSHWWNVSLHHQDPSCPEKVRTILHRRTCLMLDNILLAWIPESLLPASQSEYYVKVELSDLETPETTAYSTRADVLVPPPPQGGMYAFSIALSQIYSLLVRPPRIGWWSGSVVVNARGGETHPALFFHDAECKSTQLQQKRRMPPPPKKNTSTSLKYVLTMFRAIRIFRPIRRPWRPLLGGRRSPKVLTQIRYHSTLDDRTPTLPRRPFHLRSPRSNTLPQFYPSAL